MIITFSKIMKKDLFVIPMAGISRRFKEQGIFTDKYMLPFSDTSVFVKCVQSFKKYFSNYTFVFVIRRSDFREKWLKSQLRSFDFEYRIVLLDEGTRGPASTVFHGLNNLNAAPNAKLVISPCDLFYRVNINIPPNRNFVFCSKIEGNHWAFLETDSRGFINKLSKRICSDLASTGLYGFKSIKNFQSAYKKLFIDVSCVDGEHTLEQIIEQLIQNGERFRAYELESADVCMLGTPEEYKYALELNEK